MYTEKTTWSSDMYKLLLLFFESKHQVLAAIGITPGKVCSKNPYVIHTSIFY